MRLIRAVALPSAVCNLTTMVLAAMAGLWGWFMIAALASAVSIYGWWLIRQE